jgi:hypothetical protein
MITVIQKNSLGDGGGYVVEENGLVQLSKLANILLNRKREIQLAAHFAQAEYGS